MIYPNSAKSFEIVLILLAEMVIVYIKLIFIGFRDLNFKKMLLRLC